MSILLASLREGHDSRWALAVGPPLALATMLMGTAWASALVVSEGLGSFNSPYEPAHLNQLTLESVAQFKHDGPLLNEFFRSVPRSGAADVLETSQAAGGDILVSGREFLPVGGFTGDVPAPTVAQFERLVTTGRISRATVTTDPLTRSPVLLWVRAHCEAAGSYQADLTGAIKRSTPVYFCMPTDAKAAPNR